MDVNNDNLTEITGQFVYISNPCTTIPCLPGMAYAVTYNENSYFIISKGSWLKDNQKWDKYTPQLNDMVTITGYLHENRDVFGVKYFTVEVVTIKPSV